MVIIKRPFEIGDRIILDDVRGDVIDISLTHIYLGEIGGLAGGEEKSGRIIMVPIQHCLKEISLIILRKMKEY